VGLAFATHESATASRRSLKYRIRNAQVGGSIPRASSSFSNDMRSSLVCHQRGLRPLLAEIRVLSYDRSATPRVWAFVIDCIHQNALKKECDLIGARVSKDWQSTAVGGLTKGLKASQSAYGEKGSFDRRHNE
jgi:hypothetical protein